MFRKCMVQNIKGKVYEAYEDTTCNAWDDDLPYLVFSDDVDMSIYPEVIEKDEVPYLVEAIGDVFFTHSCWWGSNNYYKLVYEKSNNNLCEPIKIRIKYFTEDAVRLQKISVGDWIDLYANEDVVIEQGERHMIPLGIAMELPEGYEAHVVPRSSTFKTWGIIQTNHMGVIDNSYCGDNDQWHFPAYCLDGKWANEKCVPYTEIKKGDKICQFRIVKCQPPIEFVEVEELGNEDRNGFGSTGSR